MLNFLNIFKECQYMRDLYYATQVSIKRCLWLALTLWLSAVSCYVYADPPTADPPTYEALVAPVNPPAGYREPWDGTALNKGDWNPLRYQKQGIDPNYWDPAWRNTFGATQQERITNVAVASGDVWRGCRAAYHNLDNDPFWSQYSLSVFVWHNVHKYKRRS